MQDDSSKFTPAVDMKITALAVAFCDLLITERATFEAVLGLLERKGLLQSAEIQTAIESIASLSPRLVEEDLCILQKRIEERMAVRLQELMLRMGPAGPTQ